MNRRKKYRPDIERFEVRLTPAGNVTASIGSALELRGDDLGNSVLVSQTGDIVRVEGLDGTTINGLPSVEFNGAGLEKADILLFGGADRLEVSGLRTTVDQNIEMGGGNDVVVLNNVNAGVNLSVKTDGGFDGVNATAVVTGGDFFLDTGEGRSESSISGSVVGKSLTVIGGGASDFVTVAGTTTGEDLNIEVKEGSDRVSLASVRSSKNIKVDSGTGNDTVAVTDVFAAYDAVFLGEDGLDAFINRGVRAGQKLEIKGFERFA